MPQEKISSAECECFFHVQERSFSRGVSKLRELSQPSRELSESFGRRFLSSMMKRGSPIDVWPVDPFVDFLRGFYQDACDTHL